MNEIIRELKKIEGVQFSENEPMSRHTTFKIGGCADLAVFPSSAASVKRCMEVFEGFGVRYYIIGKGSNILVGDGGIRGGVIILGSNFGSIEAEGNVVKAQAGASLGAVASVCLKNGLGGFEFAAGIPGSVGGGVCMNAGAYGGELKDVIKNVTVIDKGRLYTLKNSECGFGYRHSKMLDENMVVLGAEFELYPENRDIIKEKMKELSARRSEKQPLEYPSAGSTFKRPEGYFAGKLIQDSGLRGFSVGGAQVSEKHCGFVINKGGAAAADVKSLIETVQKTVFERFGVKLEREVRYIGEF